MAGVMVGGRATGDHPKFGGSWTSTKLDIVEKYLDSYTTVMKNQNWAELVYIDAFAGTGRIMRDPQFGDETDAGDSEAFLMGSAERALQVVDRRFDRFVFVEKHEERHAKLEELCVAHAGRTIDPVHEDANDFLNGLTANKYGRGGSYTDWRGVLFVDPFGAQLDWSTIEHIASLERLDMWLLFPAGVIARMLPKSKDPADADPAWAARLNAVYGGDAWRGLYRVQRQADFFDPSGVERDAGVEGLVEIYKQRLATVFNDRLLEESRTLRNSRNSPLFELIFCVGSSSPSAIQAGKQIARHLIQTI